MKKNHWLYIALSLLSIILLIVSFEIINVDNKKNNIEIRCAGELTSRRKVNNTDLANLNEKIFLFLYALNLKMQVLESESYQSVG
ncbi:hypothetical protein Xenpb_03788 [Xenorhabdus sp. PB62.4]|nr:hypothetical protein [Xenorhabdus sp. PB62.4]